MRTPSTGREVIIEAEPGPDLPRPRDGRGAGGRRAAAAAGPHPLGAALDGREPAVLQLVRPARPEGSQRLPGLRQAHGAARLLRLERCRDMRPSRRGSRSVARGRALDRGGSRAGRLRRRGHRHHQHRRGVRRSPSPRPLRPSRPRPPPRSSSTSTSGTEHVVRRNLAVERRGRALQRRDHAGEHGPVGRQRSGHHTQWRRRGRRRDRRRRDRRWRDGHRDGGGAVAGPAPRAAPASIRPSACRTPRTC